MSIFNGKVNQYPCQVRPRVNNQLRLEFISAEGNLIFVIMPGNTSFRNSLDQRWAVTEVQLGYFGIEAPEQRKLCVIRQVQPA